MGQDLKGITVECVQQGRERPQNTHIHVGILRQSECRPSSVGSLSRDRGLPEQLVDRKTRENTH